MTVIMSDEEYIARLLDGAEQTTGPWLSGRRRNGDELDVRNRGRWSNIRRERSRNDGRSRPHNQRNTRGGRGSNRAMQGSQVFCSVCQTSVARAMFDVHVGSPEHLSNIQLRREFYQRGERGEMRSWPLRRLIEESDTEAFGRGAVTAFDPLCEEIEVKAFCTAIKVQSLTTYGPGRLYSCCCDELRAAVVVRALRNASRALDSGDMVGLSHGLREHPSWIAAISWLSIDYELPRVIFVRLERADSTGFVGAWIISVILLLQSLSSCHAKSVVEKVYIEIPSDLSQTFKEVIDQGLVHLFHTVQGIAENARCSVREISICTFNEHLGEEDGLSSWVDNILRELRASTENALELSRKRVELSKLAFLMGGHSRLGEQSSVRFLPQNVLHYIVDLCGTTAGTKILVNTGDLIDSSR